MYTVKVEIEDLLRRISSGEFAIVREILLIAKYKGVIITGIPECYSL